MANFIPTDEQWEKMKNHIKGDNYKKEDFFVFETLAVGDRVVPNRYMRLTPALLRVMEDDAKKGVSLMLNHNWSQAGVQSIPIGKVFDARIAGGTQDGEETTLYTTQYILRDDSKVDGYSKNDIIKLIESGILADTSVGWGTTRESYKCNICGHSIYDYRHCEHIPGQKYIVNEETNEVKECIVQAEPPKELHAGNNVLMENSVVFDGAYPNAIIQSAVGEEIQTSNGIYKTLSGKEELSEKDVIIGYSVGAGNINLLYKQSLEKGGLENMDKPEANATEELENEVANTEESTEATETVETEETVGTVENTEETAENTAESEETAENAEETEETEEAAETTEMSVEKAILEKFGNICGSVDELVEMAKEGLEHRNDVISEALDSGVHSMGNSFNKDIFAKTFSNMKTKDIEEMGKAWETQAKAQFEKPKVSKQEFSNENEEEAVKRVSMTQFKTGLY
jgi:hypothetical protein